MSFLSREAKISYLIIRTGDMNIDNLLSVFQGNQFLVYHKTDWEEMSSREVIEFQPDKIIRQKLADTDTRNFYLT